MSKPRLFRSLVLIGLFCAIWPVTSSGQEVHGTVKRIDTARNQIVIEHQALHREVRVRLTPDATFRQGDGSTIDPSAIKPGDRVTITSATIASDVALEPPTVYHSFVEELWHNITHNLFKPLLLFFFLGFLVPLLKIKFEFPYAFYQGLTIYLLLAIGWHGGEELAQLNPAILGPVLGFMGVGFVTNTLVGFLAYILLSFMTRLRRVDKATVAGYYGSDSAGTFVTALGVLGSVHLAFDAYMPVMLAVMEIPGCLVALFLISRLRHHGMDPAGNMPDEPGYDPNAAPVFASGVDDNGHAGHAHEPPPTVSQADAEAIELERELALEKRSRPTHYGPAPKNFFNPKLLHEVFLNPGLFLLFGGIVIGFMSRLQGPEVVREDDNFFINLFQGVLCLFLLEMGMTASKKLRDLKTAGLGFILFGLLAPNLFAILGIAVAHGYSLVTHTHFELGTYVLFAVLCAAASYIAVPAVQRLAIPEASPTLPLAAALGLTFTYNVTIGIPIYIQIAKAVTQAWPIA
jgi:hypothetical protein